MEKNRQAGMYRNIKLRLEGAELCLTRRKIAKVVQAAFPDRDALIIESKLAGL